MQKDQRAQPQGAGLGLRMELMQTMQEDFPEQVDFMEVAPENWMGVGGALGKQFRWFTERYPFIIHGLSLSLGGPAPLDEGFIQSVKKFMATYNIGLYSEHLSYCGDDGHMFDLMPIPFSEDAAKYTAERIRRTQDILGQQIAVENVSYYAAPGKEMDEIDFINAVLSEADCQLLLDVNNIYVNSVNHRYDPVEFLLKLPKERVAYIHTAGHYIEDKDLIIDTHGADIIDPVWELLATTYEHFGVIPTLLERDFNIPPLEELIKEVDMIHHFQQQAQKVPREDAKPSIVY